jgi:hypothetical protein
MQLALPQHADRPGGARARRAPCNSVSIENSEDAVYDTAACRPPGRRPCTTCPAHVRGQNAVVWTAENQCFARMGALLLSPAKLGVTPGVTPVVMAPSWLRAIREKYSITCSLYTSCCAPDCMDAGGCAAGTGRGDAAEADAVAAGDAGGGGGRASP